jgi:uncharacterized protein
VSALLVLLVACGSGGTQNGNPTAHIQVAEHTIKVEVVADEASRALGLMNRDSMPADEGMLFIYPDEKPRGFWMKNTRIPLSIAFADRQGTVLRIADMVPHSAKRVPSLYPATYALEMNKGWFEANKVAKGAKLSGLPEVEVR